MGYIGIVILILIAVVIGGLIWIQLMKNKRAKAFTITAPNGTECGEYVEIGGIMQYLHHRSENVDHPVMLFLHGGPGFPMLPFAQDFQIPWEKHVTVVQWDQRNCGKTYFKNNPDKVTPTNTLDQVIQDTYEVVQYLRSKYNQDKIIIMGHSWGSVLGSLFTMKYPQLVLSYIGVGQVVNMVETERIGYDKVLECARSAGNEKDVECLLALSPYPLQTYDSIMNAKFVKLRKLQAKYKLAAGPSKELVWSAITSPFYSIKDMRYLFIPNLMKVRHGAILDELFRNYDLTTVGKNYEVPMFYVQGEADWQTSYALAKAYFATIEAPVKRFYSIPDAGHLTMIDQKELFNKALYDIIDRSIT